MRENILLGACVLTNRIDHILDYQKKNVWQCKFNFHKTNDADIIEKLQSVPNRLGYIKALIRADIEKNR